MAAMGFDVPPDDGSISLQLMQQAQSQLAGFSPAHDPLLMAQKAIQAEHGATVPIVQQQAAPRGFSAGPASMQQPMSSALVPTGLAPSLQSSASPLPTGLAPTGLAPGTPMPRPPAHLMQSFPPMGGMGGCPQGGMMGGVEDAIDIAAGTALASIALLESEFGSFDKFRWRIAKYFRTGVQAVNFQTMSLPVILSQYADKVFEDVASACGDRAWLPQADFSLIFTTAVKSTFPSPILSQLPGPEMDQQLMKAYDTGFEKVRSMPLLWDALQGRVEGKKAQTKVYNCFEAGRNIAVRDYDADSAESNEEKVMKFCKQWIKVTIDELAKEFAQDPQRPVPEPNCIAAFNQLCTVDALPQHLSRTLRSQGIALPKPLPYVEETVKMFYKPFEQVFEPRAKRPNTGRSAPYRPAPCWYFFSGGCSKDDCGLSHGPCTSEEILSMYEKLGPPPGGIPQLMPGAMHGLPPMDKGKGKGFGKGKGCGKGDCGCWGGGNGWGMGQWGACGGGWGCGGWPMGGCGPCAGDMNGCCTGCGKGCGGCGGDMKGCGGDMKGMKGCGGDMNSCGGDMKGCGGDMKGMKGCAGDMNSCGGDTKGCCGDMKGFGGGMKGCGGDMKGCGGDMKGGQCGKGYGDGCGGCDGGKCGKGCGGGFDGCGGGKCGKGFGDGFDGCGGGKCGKGCGDGFAGGKGGKCSGDGFSCGGGAPPPPPPPPMSCGGGPPPPPGQGQGAGQSFDGYSGGY